LSTRTIAAAIERAEDDRRRKRPFPREEGRVRRIIAAIGDPQAPLSTLLAILDRQRLLGEDGRLRPEVRLVSMGDHFDYGPAEIRREAGRDGVRALCWLAAHPADQVILLLGNHDLARVGELGRFDDDAFTAAHVEALAAYRALSTDPDLEAKFLARYPMFPSAEIIARDYCTFSVEQRDLVLRLLRAGRARIAYARDPSLLLVHAGATYEDLGLIGLGREDASDALAAAEALNAFLDRAVDRWDPTADAPLDLSPLHRPGDAVLGEGRSILDHRPSHPDVSPGELSSGPPRRRYDPRTIPLGMAQAIGHIRDGKCRRLLGAWVRDEPPADGPLRSLVTDGRSALYGFGVPSAAIAPNEGRILFLDGGMSAAPTERYDLLDVAIRRRLEPLEE
jgi:calcineurin-like phosphoesterase family protein